MRSLACLAACVAVAGCAVGPDYVAPEVPVEETWLSAPAGTEPGGVPEVAWWEALEDPTLSRLVHQAVASNRDLAVAQARVREARALRSAAAAGLFPQVDVSAGGARYRISEESPTGGGPLVEAGVVEPYGELWQAGFDAAWEIDIFGGTRRRVEAAEAAEMQAAEEARALRLAVIAEVVRNYAELRGSQRRLALAGKNTRLQERTLAIVEGRRRAGLGRELDVASARAQLEATRALVPALRGQVRASAYRLAVLAGQPPGTFLDELLAEVPLPHVPEVVPTGLRSDLLRRRPDVRAAERALAAATAGVGVAEADRFPRFFLTGSAGREAGRFSDLFDGGAGLWSLGPSIRWPVFSGGAISAGIEAAGARQEAAVAAYEQAVLAALEDAETALILYGEERQTADRLSVAAEAGAKAATIASGLHEQGLSDLLTVIDAERRQTEIDDQLARSETRVLVRLAALYKALGGGWEVFEPPLP
ncbi:MAG: efflux transporter outer membrane subunit [Gammaproteobacteria bacterium]